MQTVTIKNMPNNNIMALSKKDMIKLEHQCIVAWNEVHYRSLLQSFGEMKNEDRVILFQEAKKYYAKYLKLTQQLNTENARYAFAKITKLLNRTDLYSIMIMGQEVNEQMELSFDYCKKDSEEVTYDIENKYVEKYLSKHKRYVYEVLRALAKNLKEKNDIGKVYEIEFTNDMLFEDFLKRFNIKKHIEFQIDTDLTLFE